MLKYMRALQTCCFPLPSRKRELREIEQIHNELNQRLSCGERARLQCLMDQTESMRRLTAENHFTAGVALDWHLRKGILVKEQAGGERSTGLCGVTSRQPMAPSLSAGPCTSKMVAVWAQMRPRSGRGSGPSPCRPSQCTCLYCSRLYHFDLYRETGWQHQSCATVVLGFCLHQSRR